MTKEEQKNTGERLTSNALINEEIAPFGSARRLRRAAIGYLRFPVDVKRRLKNVEPPIDISMRSTFRSSFTAPNGHGRRCFGDDESRYITMWVPVGHTRPGETGLHG